MRTVDWRMGCSSWPPKIVPAKYIHWYMLATLTSGDYLIFHSLNLDWLCPTECGQSDILGPLDLDSLKESAAPLPIALEVLPLRTQLPCWEIPTLHRARPCRKD